MIDALRPHTVNDTATCASCAVLLDPGSRSWVGGMLTSSGVTSGHYCLPCAREHVRGEPGRSAAAVTPAVPKVPVVAPAPDADDPTVRTLRSRVRTRVTRMSQWEPTQPRGNHPEGAQMMRLGALLLAAALVFCIFGAASRAALSNSGTLAMSGAFVLLCGAALEFSFDVYTGRVKLPAFLSRYMPVDRPPQEPSSPTPLHGTWSRQARGQRIAASSLERTGLHPLHDRSKPGTDVHIDHLVVGPGGVYAVNTRDYDGTLSVTSRKLLIGVRNETALVRHTVNNSRRVRKVLRKAGVDVFVRPVICMTGQARPDRLTDIHGVRISTQFNIGDVVSTRGQLSKPEQDRIVDLLAWHFPPA